MSGALGVFAKISAELLFRSHQLPRHALAKVVVMGEGEAMKAKVVTHFRIGEFCHHEFDVVRKGRTFRAVVPHRLYPERDVKIVERCPVILAKRVMDVVQPGLSAFEVNGERRPPGVHVTFIPF